jgi:hypothetical protein
LVWSAHNDTAIVRGELAAVADVKVIVADNLVDPAIALLGSLMEAVNVPVPVPPETESDTHDWSTLTVHTGDPELNATETVCAPVTLVTAPVAPFLVAANVSDEGLTVTVGPVGITGDDALLALPVPTPLVAVTVNVYAVPLVSPVTTRGLPPPDATAPPGDAVAVYPVIGAPPVLAGAVKLTNTCPWPPMPLTLVGAPGTVAGVTADDAVLGALVPISLVAVTVKV